MALSCDFLIVGAGSAGCVLARRLSDDPANKVILIEAGRARESLMIRMPAGFAYAISSRRFDWGYESESEEGLAGRTIPCPRGKVLGGSSSINAMAYVRGAASDFDEWAAEVGPRWSYRECLQMFRRIETYSEGASRYRGGEGPLHVQRPRYSSPLNQLFLSAAGDAGFSLNPDPNGAKLEGFGPMDQTISGGERVSAARAYLQPVRKRPNLVILNQTLATKMHLEKLRLAGVRVTGPEFTGMILAGETILCAGAINSPKLLLLSGIGPATALKDAGVDIRHELPGVGGNLQDHVDVSVRVSCAEASSMTPLLWEPRKTLAGLRWIIDRGGPCATNHFEVGGYVRTRQQLCSPNIQICFVPLLVNSSGRAIGRQHGFQATVMLLKPTSRGSVSLKTNDPIAAPRLHFNYLSDPDEISQIVEGIRVTRQIFAQVHLNQFRGKELEPGDASSDEQMLIQYVRHTAKSTHHPCGTCRMGQEQDPRSVVDEVCRVHGVTGLRVVDASVMPTITSGNINAPVLMIAETIAASIMDRSA